MSLPPNAPCPRLCHLIKWPDFNGYGFNLHAEKSKQAQYIGKVDDDSPAKLAGLREGDKIIEVNFVNISNENHRQVVERIKSITNETKLLVIDEKGDRWYRERKIVIKSSQSNVICFRTPIPRPPSGTLPVELSPEEASQILNRVISNGSSPIFLLEQKQQKIEKSIARSSSSSSSNNVSNIQNENRSNSTNQITLITSGNSSRTESPISITTTATTNTNDSNVDTSSISTTNSCNQQNQQLENQQQQQQESQQQQQQNETTLNNLNNHHVNDININDKKELILSNIDNDTNNKKLVNENGNEQNKTNGNVLNQSPNSSLSSKLSSDSGELNLNMTAAEMRQLIAQRKKQDIKKCNIDLRKKYEIIQQM